MATLTVLLAASCGSALTFQETFDDGIDRWEQTGAAGKLGRADGKLRIQGADGLGDNAITYATAKQTLDVVKAAREGKTVTVSADVELGPAGKDYTWWGEFAGLMIRFDEKNWFRMEYRCNFDEGYQVGRICVSAMADGEAPYMQWSQLSRAEWHKTATQLLFRIDSGHLWWQGAPRFNLKASQGAGFRHGWQLDQLPPAQILLFQQLNHDKPNFDPYPYADFDNVNISDGTEPSAAEPAEAARSDVIVASFQEGIAVDGDLADWNLSSPLMISRESSRMINGHVADDADLLGRLYASFDDERFYVALHVTDDERSGPFSGGASWQNDGAELWFDFALDSTSNDMFAQEDDYQIAVSYSTDERDNPPAPAVYVYRNGHSAHVYAASQIASKPTDDGYVIEWAAPFDALIGLDGQPGEVIGFNISLCDQDLAQGRFSRLLWMGDTEADPRNFGFMTLGPVEPQRLSEIIEQAKKTRRGQPKLQAKSDDADAPRIDKADYKGPPQFLSVETDGDQIGRYEKFELDVDLAAEFDNPYDYDDFVLQAEFTAPNGQTTTVDGFYTQAYRMSLGYRGRDNTDPVGEPFWQVRFTPTQLGEYRYVLIANDRQGRTARTEPAAFTAVASQHRGFLRVSPRDPRYLEFDDGSPFFSLGYGNHEWSASPSDIINHKRHQSQLAFYGGNTLSVNFDTLADSPFQLESQNTGLRKYSLLNAFKFDYALDMARKRGIYLQPCIMQTANGFGKHWAGSRFNKVNGGPCKAPEDIFTNDETRALVRNRLRYAIARWAYSPNLLAWELFNEVNYTDGFQKNIQTVRDWHREMAAWIKQLDPNKHLVSTCFGSGDACEDDEIWKMDLIDFTITHEYTNDAASVRQRQWRKRTFGKPNLGGEFGIGYPLVNDAWQFDREGIFLHNGIWTCAMAGSAGNILFWWDAQYHDPLDCYEHFTAFRRFADGIDWPAHQFKPIELLANQQAGETRYFDFQIDAQPVWDKPAAVKYILARGILWAVIREIDQSITDPREVEAADRFKTTRIPGTLFGANHPQFQRDLVIIVETDRASQMEFPLTAVETCGTSIEVLINARVAESLDLPDADGKNNPYADELDRTLTVPLAAGTTTVTLRNTGSGWLGLGGPVVRNFARSAVLEQAQVFGLQGDGLSILWFHNRQNISDRHLRDDPSLTPIDNVAVTLRNVADGRYTVEWWDTYQGEIFKTETADTAGGTLTLAPPTFEKDIACKIKGPHTP